jgi:hypothetical protein
VFSDASVIIGPDPQLANCLRVLTSFYDIRLIPSLLPDHFTAHFLEGDPPTAFKGVSHTGKGMPCGTKDEILALLVAELAKQTSAVSDRE